MKSIELFTTKHFILGLINLQKLIILWLVFTNIYWLILFTIPRLDGTAWNSSCLAADTGLLASCVLLWLQAYLGQFQRNGCYIQREISKTKLNIDKALIWIRKLNIHILVTLIGIKISLQYEMFWPFGFWEKWQNTQCYGCYGNGQAFRTHWTHDENSVNLSFKN